ncbi:MAG: META domain-containing protein, partial [Bacteroidota bacterium]
FFIDKIYDMKNTPLSLVLILSLLWAFTACKSSQATTEKPSTESPNLNNTSWTVTVMGIENGRPAPVLAESQITLTFKDRGIAGNTGCNSYSSACEIKGNGMKVSEIMHTEAYCNDPKGIMNQEAQYLAFLKQAQSFEIQKDGSLRISCSGGNMILLTEASGN